VPAIIPKLDEAVKLPDSGNADPVETAESLASLRNVLDKEGPRREGNNRRLAQRAKGRAWQRLRSERVGRSFADVCDTGGSRRSWIRAFVEVTKRYRIAAAAHNLARIMRLLFGIDKPRVLQSPADLV
jgi:transposase